MSRLLLDRLDTPVGPLLVATTDAALCALYFGEPDDGPLRLLRARFVDSPCAEKADPLGVTSRLRAYFAGSLAALDDLPVDTGGTPFQREVWTALRAITAGATISYGELARRIGRASAVRAVGLANGANPVSIVLPCHRVVGADGSLTGYGGGLHRKRWLLEHEGAWPRTLV